MMDYEEYEAKRISPSAGFFILMGLLGAGLVIGGMIGLGFFSGITGTRFSAIPKAILDPANANATRLMQFISQLFMFFIPALITARLMKPRPFTQLGYREGFNWKQLLLAIALLIVSMPLVGALGELNKAIPLSQSLENLFKKMEDDYTSQVEAIATMRSAAEFIFSLVIMALLPAVFEETFFRGGLQQILIAWFKKPIIAIVVTSILFSALHISFFGFLPRVALGLVLGLVFYYSGSIWLSMALHFINNAFAISLMYYFSTHGKPVKEATETNAPTWMALPALILVVLLLRIFQKISQQRNISKIPPMDGPSLTSNLA
jgi:uncharacterized protein